MRLQSQRNPDHPNLRKNFLQTAVVAKRLLSRDPARADSMNTRRSACRITAKTEAATLGATAQSIGEVSR